MLPVHTELLPLKDYLAKIKPKRIRPRNSVPSYSNFAYSLLGRIVERTNQDGLTFEQVDFDFISFQVNFFFFFFLRQFVRKRIFDPLQLNKSVISPRDPAVDNDPTYWKRVAPQKTHGATLSSDGADLGQYSFSFVPAGDMMMTSADMARYLRFHLSGCQDPHGKQLLTQESCDALSHSHFGEPVGTGYGLYQTVMGNLTVYGHDGDMPTASSRMMIMKQQNIAYFYSVGKGKTSNNDDKPLVVIYL